MNDSEFLRPAEAMALLGIRHPDTLRRLRRARPGIAVLFGGMTHFRYLRARILALRDERPLQAPLQSPSTLV